MNYTEEISPADWQSVDNYMAKCQENVRLMLFNNLAAICERVLPRTGFIQPGMRFSLNNGLDPVQVLAQVIEVNEDLYFSILSSRHNKIPCQPLSLVEVSVLSVYQGTKPSKTPPLPLTKFDWDNLEGSGSCKLHFWYLLCQFKKYSENCYYRQFSKR